MPRGLRSGLALILAAVALAGCGLGSPDTVIETRTERWPCPLVAPVIQCEATKQCPTLPAFPEFEGGSILEAERAYKCGRLADACKASKLRLWEDDYADCAGRLGADRAR